MIEGFPSTQGERCGQRDRADGASAATFCSRRKTATTIKVFLPKVKLTGGKNKLLNGWSHQSGTGRSLTGDVSRQSGARCDEETWQTGAEGER